jgi:hypothetical protein
MPWGRFSNLPAHQRRRRLFLRISDWQVGKPAPRCAQGITHGVSGAARTAGKSGTRGRKVRGRSPCDPRLEGRSLIPQAPSLTPQTSHLPPLSSPISIREEQTAEKGVPSRVFLEIVSRKRHTFPDIARTTVQAPQLGRNLVPPMIRFASPPAGDCNRCGPAVSSFPGANGFGIMGRISLILLPSPRRGRGAGLR